MTDLKKNIWTEKYYQRIEKVDDLSHPGFKKVIELSKNCSSVLDVGCGDGTKLSKLGSRQTKRVGCEVSHDAVRLARKKFPTIKFQLYDGTKLPFPDNTFDLTCNFFVMEHTQQPQKIVDEMLRVTRPGGITAWLAPNYGAPNRASPNFTGSRLKKLIQSIKVDYTTSTSLEWRHVEPKIHSLAGFESDLDTTVEPYLGTLIKHVQTSADVLFADSFWSMELENPSFLQKIFGVLASFNVYPFTFWGPHLFLVVRKK